ncbi:MAG: class I SAM-dependent methyltransferase [Bacteroidales bacterium]|jgi:SAM-dependent methyltransferase|nr:class I SAM-dependent methyltransferase [Bacteroidales bacterium]NCU36497.1 class I SAM-dependent methyltransferase [Candidatus Falkowbacteria bacterium]MDD2633618.1 class I SAM-dependent methyltransferase [Bacteroidales bacterium]MDD3130943.1 class I SAM-dependent methyltransferase [Bacteroidales bacterium]MDD4177889.1 class I SAM-dependent methyltransferase [Bacteroidales bacterium]
MTEYANRWDARYAAEAFYYGEHPNVFFAEQLRQFKKPGKILLPAEGTGRNAIYAAELGWQVDAFDASRVARQIALEFAQRRGVSIDYTTADLKDFDPEPEQYDVAAAIYVHLPEALRKKFHQQLAKAIKPGGMVIIEAFDKEQLKRDSGGPPDVQLLYTTEILHSDFAGLLELKMLCRQQVHLTEGRHLGNGEVVRYVGVK